MRSSRIVNVVLAAGFLFYCSCVAAGVAEDYDDGISRYRQGDVVAATPLIRRAADAGHAEAQATLAEIYYESGFDEEAAQYFRKAADQNNAYAQLRLGGMYVEGQGVAPDLKEARRWISMAAEQGNKSAAESMASAYIGGGLGIPDAERKGTEALRWIKTAAELGFLPAMEALAGAYRNGTHGLAADVQVAEQWADKVKKAKSAGKATRRGKKKE
jgi:hypothetical protein